MADSIIDGTLFNTANIMYTSPKATAQGAKSVNILNKHVKIQTIGCEALFKSYLDEI